jgi:hypothetical protein
VTALTTASSIKTKTSFTCASGQDIGIDGHGRAAVAGPNVNFTSSSRRTEIHRNPNNDIY